MPEFKFTQSLGLEELVKDDWKLVDTFAENCVILANKPKDLGMIYNLIKEEGVYLYSTGIRRG